MPTQLAPTSGTMGYGLPAAVAAALRFKDRPVVCVAGDGDFLMNGQELATAAQYGADLLVILVDNGSLRHDPHAPGARISEADQRRPSSATPTSPRSPALSAAGPRRSRRPRISRRRSIAALERKGIRLIHCKTDVEQISNATTISSYARKRKAELVHRRPRRRSSQLQALPHSFALAAIIASSKSASMAASTRARAWFTRSTTLRRRAAVSCPLLRRRASRMWRLHAARR